MTTANPSSSNLFKVGVFTVAGLLLIGAISVFVNHKPYWWRPCQLVYINVEDATGLKAKSPIRSLGLEIGYLETVELSETHVTLGICITAQVEILPTTRAYLRSEGFLGDKFVELKPVKYVGPVHSASIDSFRWLDRVAGLIEPSAFAEDPPPPPPGAGTGIGIGTKPGREIPVGDQSEDIHHLVNRVDTLIQNMTGLTNNLKQGIDPEELKRTMHELNRTLENASRTLSPQGGLNQTAQRTLAKLEDAVEQLRDILTRINQGQGSVGMLINDPVYAEELRAAIKNVNNLLNRVNNVRFVVDVGAEEISAFNGGRGWFQLAIWPKPDRYYLLGISVDPRGRLTVTDTCTTSGGVTTCTHTNSVEQTGILLTGMIGKVLWNRLDLSVGALNGDGAFSQDIYLGPEMKENWIQLRNDVYSHTAATGIDDRVTIMAKTPWSVYFKAGLESIHSVNGVMPWFYGAGVMFDDEDIKLLFALK